MNKTIQKTIEKIESILNKNKDLFGDDIEYIEVNYIHTNIYNVKSKIEIWKKIEDQQGLHYVNYFHVYKNETYEKATNNLLEIYQNF